MLRFTLLFFGLVALLGAAERDIVRTFVPGPDCAVSVDTYRGAITVAEADTSEVKIAVHLAIGADTEPEAERMLQTLRLDLSQAKSAVNVVARRPAETGARFVWNDDKQIEPTYRITVPRRCSLNLRTHQGTIIVGQIEGAVTARTETGDVFLRHVKGTADASTDTGDIVVSRCEGPVTARVRHGTIRVGTVTGRCDLSNASGDVEVMAAKAELHVFAEAGNATVGLPRDYAGAADVRTSGGAIVMKIDPAANCEVDASASVLARVESRMALTLKAGRSGSRKLTATLNRGGSRVVLRASGGNVRIEPGETPFE